MKTFQLKTDLDKEVKNAQADRMQRMTDNTKPISEWTTSPQGDISALAAAEASKVRKESATEAAIRDALEAAKKAGELSNVADPQVVGTSKDVAQIRKVASERLSSEISDIQDRKNDLQRELKDLHRKIPRDGRSAIDTEAVDKLAAVKLEITECDSWIVAKMLERDRLATQTTFPATDGAMRYLTKGNPNSATLAADGG